MQKISLVAELFMSSARSLADKRGDVGFWIQIHTGCRKGEHQGLRWCDIDLKENTIRFEEWIKGRFKRTLKGHEKDERTVPINSKLRKKLIEMLPEVFESDEDDPI